MGTPREVAEVVELAERHTRMVEQMIGLHERPMEARIERGGS